MHFAKPKNACILRNQQLRAFCKTRQCGHFVKAKNACGALLVSRNYLQENRPACESLGKCCLPLLAASANRQSPCKNLLGVAWSLRGPCLCLAGPCLGFARHLHETCSGFAAELRRICCGVATDLLPDFFRPENGSADTGSGKIREILKNHWFYKHFC